MSCYITQEDGFLILLEDASGALIQEACAPPTPGGELPVGGEARRGRRRRLEVIEEEEDLFAVLTAL